MVPFVCVPAGGKATMQNHQTQLVQPSTSQVDASAEKPLLLSLDAAAQCLSLAEKTIRKWLSDGTCPFQTVKIGGRRLVRRVDLEKFVNELGSDPSEKPTAEISVGPNLKRGRGRPRNTSAPVH